jgi:hypothetical protein
MKDYHSTLRNIPEERRSHLDIYYYSAPKWTEHVIPIHKHISAKRRSIMTEDRTVFVGIMISGDYIPGFNRWKCWGLLWAA